jgi:hypothetical protein
MPFAAVPSERMTTAGAAAFDRLAIIVGPARSAAPHAIVHMDRASAWV